jgi:hypothetical protein
MANPVKHCPNIAPLAKTIFGLIACLFFFVLPARAQDDIPWVLDGLIAERYQTDGQILVNGMNATEAAAALLATLDAQLPAANVWVYDGTAPMPTFTTRWLYVVVFDKTQPVPRTLGSRYALLETADGRDGRLLVYRRTPGALQPLVRFGDSVALVGWHLDRPAQVQPCDVLHLESWWTANAPIPQDYSMTISLNPPDEDGIARTDGAPANSQMRLWQPGNWIIDERDLVVPCDAPPGEYFIIMGVYDWTNNNAGLPVFPDGWLQAHLTGFSITSAPSNTHE